MAKRKDPKDFLKMGRPTLYSDELATEICETIGSSEKGLLSLVEENPHWPRRSVIFRWILKYSQFRDMYHKAKEQQTDVSFEYMQELMAEPHYYIEKDTGQKRVDVNLLRLKINTMQWQVAKLKPRKYGDVKSQDLPNAELEEDINQRYHDMEKEDKKE